MIKKEITEGEVRQLNEELKFIRQDLSLQKLESASRVAQLQTELEKLRSQLINIRQNGNSSSTENELEKRSTILFYFHESYISLTHLVHIFIRGFKLTVETVLTNLFTGFVLLRVR